MNVSPQSLLRDTGSRVISCRQVTGVLQSVLQAINNKLGV